MFILIPLILILTSVVGIFVIVYRKMPYLNKLNPESHPSVRSGFGWDFVNELFPELSEGIKNLKLREYGHLWLIELEKFIRKLRVVSLKMDRISESWIKRIRKGRDMRTTNPVIADKAAEENLISKTQNILQITVDDMKREEQKMIIEIAKNPKDSKLYETLGDLYIKMNNMADAKESFEAAVELNPHDEFVKEKLTLVLGKLSSQN